MIFIVMEKNAASNILKIAKLLYKDNNPFVSKYSWSSDYEFNLPKPILSIHGDEDFLRALFVENKDSFDEWSTMDESKVIIPVLKTYDIVTKFSGSEAVVRTYSDRVDAYSQEDLESRLNNCDPCYDDGEEVDVEWFDREGDWEIDSIEQITEEDINRIVKKVLK
jgi:hypothetical protein